MRVRSYALVVIVLFTVACGSGAEAQPIVDVAAQWECDRQRFAFDSLQDINDARAEALAEAGITEEEFVAFEVQVDSDPDLRNAVFVAYEQYCGTPEDAGVIPEG